LAANAKTNHFALFPQAPQEPNSKSYPWFVICPESACRSSTAWQTLPIFVDSVIYGYSMVAGGAGESPKAIVSVNSDVLRWPTMTSAWYVVTAVGDPTWEGHFTTIVASSFWNDVRVDDP